MLRYSLTRTALGSGREPAAEPTPALAAARRDGSRRPRTSTVPASGVTTPRHMSNVVVLPAPLGSEQTDQLALPDEQVDAVDRATTTVVLDEAGGPQYGRP